MKLMTPNEFVNEIDQNVNPKKKLQNLITSRNCQGKECSNSHIRSIRHYNIIDAYAVENF